MEVRRCPPVMMRTILIPSQRCRGRRFCCDSLVEWHVNKLVSMRLLGHLQSHVHVGVASCFTSARHHWQLDKISRHQQLASKYAHNNRGTSCYHRAEASLFICSVFIH